MRDEELRRLERAAKEGDREAARKYLRERVRLGFDPEPWWTPTAEQIECSETRVLPVAKTGLTTKRPYVLIPETVVDTGPFYLMAEVVSSGDLPNDYVRWLGGQDGFKATRLPTMEEWGQIESDSRQDFGSNGGMIVSLLDLGSPRAASLGLIGDAWEWGRHVEYPTAEEMRRNGWRALTALKAISMGFRVVGVV